VVRPEPRSSVTKAVGDRKQLAGLVAAGLVAARVRNPTWRSDGPTRSASSPPNSSLTSYASIRRIAEEADIRNSGATQAPTCQARNATEAPALPWGYAVRPREMPSLVVLRLRESPRDHPTRHTHSAPGWHAGWARLNSYPWTFQSWAAEVGRQLRHKGLEQGRRRALSLGVQWPCLFLYLMGLIGVGDVPDSSIPRNLLPTDGRFQG
jgi:hypothetical protein